MTYRLQTDLVLDRSIEEVFAFFADATNLEAITPPELRFRILTPRPIELHEGARIDYRLSLYGIPFSWHTEISCWEPGVRFIDRQISGPFHTWIHRHDFEALGTNQTRIRDEVEYRLPLEPLGRLAHPLVRAKLDRIFSYRTESVRERLGITSQAGAPS